MFELIKITDKTYYFDIPTKIGVYKLDDKKVMLIDSGLNAKTADRVLKVLEDNGLEVAFIVNTHSHTDHAGGNRYLCETAKCKAYAPEVEDVLIEYSDVEATLVYGGFPCRDFRKKFMNTESCKTYPLSEAPLPEGTEILRLPGHTAHMIGVKTPDDVYFIADVVNGKNAIDKAKICYVYDITTQLETLEKLKELDGKLCVPAHTDPTENIAYLAKINIENLLEIRQRILNTLKEKPMTTEELTASLCRQYGLKVDFMILVMITSAIRSHLVSLRHSGKLDWFIEDYMHYWKIGEE
ncbi:MAG: MBL fold metallo-hydrolase [Clostridia bacterium]|nr:MBL fold metallo-hydrolase [Clostridia bacterium]